MKKSILNLKGAQELSKNEQKALNGGGTKGGGSLEIHIAKCSITPRPFTLTCSAGKKCCESTGKCMPVSSLCITKTGPF